MVSPSQGTTGELVRMADRALAADYRKSSTAAQMSRSSHVRLCWPLRPPQEKHRAEHRHQPRRQHNRLPIDLPRIHYLLRKRDRPSSHQYGYRMLSQPYLLSHGYRKLSQPYLPSHGYRKLSQPYLPSHGYRKLSLLPLRSHSSQLWPPKTAALWMATKATKYWTG